MNTTAEKTIAGVCVMPRGKLFLIGSKALSKGENEELIKRTNAELARRVMVMNAIAEWVMEFKSDGAVWLYWSDKCSEMENAVLRDGVNAEMKRRIKRGEDAAALLRLRNTGDNCTAIRPKVGAR